VDEERKPLTLTGTNVGLDFAKSALHKVGFDALNEIAAMVEPPVSRWYKTYFPILLILAYLIAFVTLPRRNASGLGACGATSPGVITALRRWLGRGAVGRFPQE